MAVTDTDSVYKQTYPLLSIMIGLMWNTVLYYCKRFLNPLKSYGKLICKTIIKRVNFFIEIQMNIEKGLAV